MITNECDENSLSAMYKVLANDVEILRDAIESNPELLTFPDERGCSMLHHVCASGNKDCFSLLLQQKDTNLHAKDINHNTPLHVSCYYGNWTLSEILIAKGCSINAKNNMHFSPLDCCTAGVNDKNLLQLCQASQYDQIQNLLDINPTSMGKRDKQGWSALHICSANGWFPGVKLLLDRGMKSSLVDYTGRSALHLAARFGHSEVCRVLLEVSTAPQVNLLTYGKAWTPLMFACFHDHIHVAVLLLAHGADHKIRNSEKKSAFQYVLDKDKLQLLTDLVSTGDDSSPTSTDVQQRLAAIFSPNQQQLRKQQVNNNSQVFNMTSLGKVGGSPSNAGMSSLSINPTRSPPVKSPSQIIMSQSKSPVKLSVTRSSFSPPSARPPTSTPPPSQRRARSFSSSLQIPPTITTPRSSLATSDLIISASTMGSTAKEPMHTTSMHTTSVHTTSVPTTASMAKTAASVVLSKPSNQSITTIISDSSNKSRRQGQGQRQGQGLGQGQGKSGHGRKPTLPPPTTHRSTDRKTNRPPKSNASGDEGEDISSVVAEENYDDDFDNDDDDSGEDGGGGGGGDGDGDGDGGGGGDESHRKLDDSRGDKYDGQSNLDPHSSNRPRQKDLTVKGKIKSVHCVKSTNGNNEGVERSAHGLSAKTAQAEAQQALLLDFDSSELAALVPSQISQSNHHAPVKPPSQIVDELIEEVSSFAAVPTGNVDNSKTILRDLRDSLPSMGQPKPPQPSASHRTTKPPPPQPPQSQQPPQLQPQQQHAPSQIMLQFSPPDVPMVQVQKGAPNIKEGRTNSQRRSFDSVPSQNSQSNHHAPVKSPSQIIAGSAATGGFEGVVGNGITNHNQRTKVTTTTTNNNNNNNNNNSSNHSNNNNNNHINNNTSNKNRAVTTLNTTNDLPTITAVTVTPMTLFLEDMQLQEYHSLLLADGFRMLSDFQDLTKEECATYFSYFKKGDLLRLIKVIPTIGSEFIREREEKAQALNHLLD